ncbi:carbon-nitrogen hydrolase family protein [Paracoccaceae bacterium]
MPESVYPLVPLRVAIVQMTSATGWSAENLDRHLTLAEEAGRRNCRLVLFPELSLCGYTVDPAVARRAAQPEAALCDGLAPLIAACRTAGVTAVAGGIVTDGDQLFIAAITVDGEGIAGIYRKRHLHAPEKAVFSAGAAQGILSVAGWRIGLGICFDGSVPDHAAQLSAAGCQVYALSALFGTTGGREESRLWLPERARSNRMFTLLSNHVGPAGAWMGCGSAAAWAPDGNLIAEADSTTAGLLVMDLDPGLLEHSAEC